MARAARAFGRRDWLQSARRALDFIRATMWKEGRLLATYKDGRAHLDAYLDDHAFLLAALIEMLQADFRAEDLEWAEELGDALMDRFLDREGGGFFFTAHDHERLIQRPKPGPDNATPSGNGVAAWTLNRLAFLTGEIRYSDAASGAIALFLPQVDRQPSAFGSLLKAIEEQLTPPRTLILRGAREGFADWKALLDPAYVPTTITLSIPAEAKPLPPVLDKAPGAPVNAWLCEGMTCLPAMTSIAQLRDSLDLPTMRARESSPA